jgi:hypothetical protein
VNVLGYYNVRLTQHTFLIIYVLISKLLHVSAFFLLDHHRTNLTQFRQTSFLQRIRCHYFLNDIIFFFKIKIELKLFSHVMKCASWIIRINKIHVKLNVILVKCLK